MNTAVATSAGTVAATADETPWQRGRFDGKSSNRQVLFGRMYEDPTIELDAFASGARVFCIASAGCTAMALATQHDVVAVDINPVQLAYAHTRICGAPGVHGTAERVMSLGRTFLPLVGWRRSRVAAFLELADPTAQIAFWRDHLDTARFRFALDAMFSVVALRAVYAPQFLDFLPRDLGAVMRSRLARGFARHANRQNPYARALLAGELPRHHPAQGHAIELVHSDAAAYLEQQPAGTFGGFTLSNILDGAAPSYRDRLFAAVRHAAAPGAVVVLRSFREPHGADAYNHAASDRALLWGVVDVRPVAELPRP